MPSTLTTDFDTLVQSAATLLGFLSLAFIPLVLLRQKEAPATIAWIMTLVFLPLIGVVMFWFLGRDRVRIPARRKQASNTTVRSRLGQRLPMLVSTRQTLESVIRSRPDEERGMMRLAANVGRSDVSGGNAVRILVGAAATYDAHVEAIERATRHVHVEFYIVADDVVGLRLRDALVRARARGVEVRFLYDGFGSRGLGRHFLEPLRAAGAEVAKFLPLDPVRRAWTFNLRNHRKLMVVDGELGFCGGINIGATFVDWVDLHLALHGPIVRKLQAVFAEDWHFATRHDLVTEEYFIDVPPHGDSIVQVVDSGPDATVESVHRLYFGAISSARESVRLTTPYFVPDRPFLVALQTAALRGVDVQLVVPRDSNHRVTFHAGRSYYADLLAAGVKVHEYTPGMLHAKLMVVDGRFATVGSANLDVRSFRLNFELIALLWDRKSVAALDHFFEETLARTERVEPSAWERRGLVQRMKEGTGRLCAPLL